MKTEEEIIYLIWNVVRAGEINQDDPINERLMRSFLRSHRGKHLNQYYKGNKLPDECFQNLGLVPFTLSGNNWVSQIMPKVIRFNENFGMMINKNNYVISTVSSEEFETSKKDKFNKFHPKVKFIDGKLWLYLGIENTCSQFGENNSLQPLNVTVRSFLEEAKTGTITANVRCVLVDPDDEPGYDFTASPYPFPDELMDSLINSVNARDFNLFLRTRSDETTDNRDNVAEKNTREEL